MLVWIVHPDETQLISLVLGILNISGEISRDYLGFFLGVNTLTTATDWDLPPTAIGNSGQISWVTHDLLQ